MKWTWWDIFVATCIACAAIFVHNLYQYHPPMPRPPPTLTEKMGLWGNKVSSPPRGGRP